jgi:hypothetical protein
MDTVSSSCLQSYKKRKLASGAPTGKPPHFRGLIDNRDLYTVKHIVSSPSIKERDCPQPKKIQKNGISKDQNSNTNHQSRKTLV